MPGSTTSSTPFGVKIIITLLIVKSALPILGEILPRIMLTTPMPFSWGLFTVLFLAVLLPLVIAVTLIRSPATGFWSTLAYAGFAAIVSSLVILAPKFATVESFELPNPDPFAEARAFEYAWRLVSIAASVLLALSVLRPSVFRWIAVREDYLRVTRFPSRRTATIASRTVWVMPLIAGAILPTLVWYAAERYVGHIRIGDALMIILLEHLRGRAVMLDLFSMLPFAVLATTAYKNARRMSLITLWAVTLGGLIGIAGLMVPLYYMGWETFYNDIRGDEKTIGAMIFFFTPLYCIATMLGGMLLGYVTARFVRKGVDDLIEDHS